MALHTQYANDVQAAVRHCETVARQSRSNFYYAFAMLPRDMFQDMCVLYAFMRLTDDLGDDAAIDLDVRQAALRDWSGQLAAALQTTDVAHPVLLATGDLARRRGIPATWFQEVIDGVEGDLTPRRFETFPELERYCYQVAGVVGLCCLPIWGLTGTDDPDPSALACGTAFQLTNILRDLKEDWLAGRVYLPLEDLQAFGCVPEDFQQTPAAPQVRALVRFEVDRAWSFYRQALPLLELLSPPGRRILTGFLDIYSSLLREMEHSRYDVLSRRIRLSRRKKMALAIRGLLRMPKPVPRFETATSTSPTVDVH